MLNQILRVVTSLRKRHGIAARYATSLAAAAISLFPLTSAASVTVSVSDGTQTLLCGDGNTCDSSGVNGLVNFSGALPNWLFTSSTGIAKPAQGTAVIPSLSLTNIALSSFAPGGTLTVKLSETGFTTQSGINAFDFTAGGTLASGASVKVDAYMDNTDVLFGQGVPLGSPLGPFITNSFSGSSSVSGSGDGSFSLTLVATITAPTTVATSVSLNSQLSLQPVPVPAAIWLFGSALAGIGVVGRPKRPTA